MRINEWSLRQKVSILILIFAVCMAISGALVHGELIYECQGDASYHNWTEDTTTHGELVPCQFGCDPYTGLCKDTPMGYDGLPTVFVLTSLMVAFFIIAAIGTFGTKENEASTGLATPEAKKSISGYWWVLRYMFVVFGLYMGQADAAAVSQMLKSSAQTSLQGIVDAVYGFFVFSGIFMTWLFAAIILVMLFDHIVAVIKWFAKRRNDG